MYNKEESLKVALSNISDTEIYKLDEILADYKFKNKGMHLRTETVEYLKALDNFIIALQRDIFEMEGKKSETEKIEKKKIYTEKLLSYTNPVMELNRKLKEYLEELNEYAPKHEKNEEYRIWQSGCRETHRLVLIEIQKIRDLVRECRRCAG